MKYRALACDYDGTIAHHGKVDVQALDALRHLREQGRRLILVSGRELEDLERVFDHSHLFDRMVLENGAVLHDPATRETRVLAPPPSASLVEELLRRRVAPLSVGRAIIATKASHLATVTGILRRDRLPLQAILNKDSVMVLPQGVNKASGLRAALADLDLTARHVVGVGDAENDLPFLGLCGHAVAVANALPEVKEVADRVTRGDHGAGVVELIDRLLREDREGMPAHVG